MKINLEEYMKVQDFLDKLQQLIDEERIIVWDEDSKRLKSIVEWHWNGPSIQLNAEKWDDDDAV